MTLCNINQGRRSFFLAHGLQNDSKTLKAVLGQAYFGVTPELVSTKCNKAQITNRNTTIFKKTYQLHSIIISPKKQGRSHEDMKRKDSVKTLFTDETILRKGLLADAMYSETWSKVEARKSKVYYESHCKKRPKIFTYALIIMKIY